jgi:hypothetical protein
MVALSKNCSNPSSANSAPFYARVPKTPRENVAYRRATLEAARRDPDTARALYAICAQDCLFWLNTFGWIYEPRTPAVLPFITYECQDQAINTLLESLGTQDVGIEKSRDMGASWLVLAAFCWRWQFHPMQSFLLVSRTETSSNPATTPMPSSGSGTSSCATSPHGSGRPSSHPHEPQEPAERQCRQRLLDHRERRPRRTPHRRLPR